MSTFDFSHPLIMGVLNVTPDSFSDGGRFASPDSAMQQVQKMVEEGVDIIDVGGESTRPGAQEVSVQQELDRVVPLVQAITSRFDVAVSVDTSKACVMTEAVAAGADMINDVRALQEPGALAAAVQADAYVCLMHMQGQPRTMQNNPIYKNVTQDVYDFLSERMKIAREAGIDRSRLLVDPGFGFGKTLEHNLVLLRELSEFQKLGVPVLAGMSRKSMIGAILDKPVDQRLYGSLAVAMLALLNGASILRVHDVAATVDILKTYLAYQSVK